MTAIIRLACSLMLIPILVLPAWAIELGLPLDCEYGVGCFIQNYVDVDLTGARKDYNCGMLTYDGHTGTDFRVSWADYEKGVNVLAAADGVVYRIRDGVEDRDARGREAEVSSYGLGNAVLLRHPDGFLTSYGHLKRGSVRVKKGDTVKRGQVLGQVGLSGLTHFTHVHFGVKQYGYVICPFKGVDNPPECGEGPQPLWADGLEYIPTGVLQAGFVGSQPSLPKTLRARPEKVIASRAKVLGYAVTVFGVQPGDRTGMRVVGPSGRVFAKRTESVGKHQAQRLFVVGRKLKNKPGWPVGMYRGEFQLIRGGKVLLSEVRTVRVE